MNEKEQNIWLNTKTTNLIFTKEYYHHHAYEIINTHQKLKGDVINCFNSGIEIEPRIKITKGKKSKAISASELNKEIRKLLNKKLKTDIKLEVVEDRGVFYFSSNKSSIGGFDFAILNHEKNLNSLRNLCFGEVHFHEGQKKWDNFLKKNKDLEKIAKHLKKNSTLGKNSKYNQKDLDTPLIVGEIQFGNWALAYRDFFKVLKANVQNSIDCLIYIVPTDNLESKLSDGIVTFDKTVKIIEEFSKVISVPVWVIGIDMK